jgi:hypothetical protein
MVIDVLFGAGFSQAALMEAAGAATALNAGAVASVVSVTRWMLRAQTQPTSSSSVTTG